MRISLRRQVRQRDRFACAYCGVTEEQVGSELTVDHFQPRIAGGSDDLANLVYCCFACNAFKGDWWNPNGVARLLHPLQEDVSLHIYLEPDGLLTPLTAAGRFHCEHLQLNRPPLIANRQMRLRELRADAERQALLDELATTNERLRTILARFGVVPDSSP